MKSSIIKSALLLITLIVFSCSTVSAENPPKKLTLTHSIVTITDGVKTDSTWVVNTKGSVLTLKINSLEDGGYNCSYFYKKSRWINDTTSIHYLRSIKVNGDKLVFSNPEEFLNYIYERGYEMTHQVINKYSIEYTFKHL